MVPAVRCVLCGSARRGGAVSFSEFVTCGVVVGEGVITKKDAFFAVVFVVVRGA